MPSRSVVPPLLLLLLSFLLFHGTADAAARRPAPRPLRVSRANIAEFGLMVPRAPYYCRVSGNLRQLGTLSPNRLRIGSIWVPASAASLQRSIASVVRNMRRMEARRMTGSRSYRAQAAKLRQLNAQLQFLLDLKSACENPPPPPAPPAPPVPPAPGPSPGAFGGVANSLAAYREQLAPEEVAHLLNKIAFGGTAELRQVGLTQGLTALVNALVDGIDADTAAEQDAAYWTDRGLYRPDDRPGVSQWTVWAVQWGEFVRLLYSKNPFREYMLLLLHGQFAVNLNAINFAFNDAAGSGIPEHIDRLRRHSLGNFLSLAQEMVADRAMSEWLNNDNNHVEAPNQNFAREFMELFTLGAIDPVNGQPNYDERSIVAATGYFSGFEGQWSTNPANGQDVFQVIYNEDLHDRTSRRIFPGVAGADRTGALDWVELPGHILNNHAGSARYIGERLFAQLVYPDVPENIVLELANELRVNHFELKPFLKKVLRSNAMFSTAAVKPCVSSPVEAMTRLYRKLLRAALPRDGEPGQQSEWLLWSYLENLRAMGQLPFEPPSVFGWKGACGVNRGGVKAEGEGFLGAQRVLNRDRTCVDQMNHISWSWGGFDYATLFPSRSISAEDAVTFLSRSLFDSELTQAQRTLLVNFLTSERDEQNQLQPLQFDLNDYWYVQRKVPRIICMLQGLLDNNLR